MSDSLVSHSTAMGDRKVTDPAENLRQITEDDVAEALKGAYISLPLTDTAQVLEAFNLILDMKLGIDKDD